jgi:ABC-type Na+ efflux pump permease subunit
MASRSIPIEMARDAALPSDLVTTWLIARRAALESLRDRTTVGISALWSLVAPFLLVLLVLRPQADRTGDGRALAAAMAVYLLVVGLMPSSGAVGIAAGLFAGEREQGNLLPLLATPASNRAIFGGKVLGAVLPTLLYAGIAEVSYLAEIWQLLGASTLQRLPLALSGAMVALVPAVAILGAGVASLVSSRVRTYQSAQMLSSLALYPIMAVLIGVAIQMQRWGPSALLLAVGAVVALDVLLILLSAAIWRREEVLARR